MYKVEGYNPEGGDWFWAKYQPDGSVDAAGKVASCAGCHLGIADNKDGILRWGFEAEPAVASAAGSEAVANVMQQMEQQQQPEQMPETGGVANQNLLIALVAAGVLLISAGFVLRRKAVTIRE
jgi:LPXTG-motif cell wall-anchored protein